MANVISADATADKHYRHAGFSDTITDSYSSPSTTPEGITGDGTNVISADAQKHWKHTGFSAVISSSYASPSSNPTGITWTGTHVISADSGLNKHYLHSGFSATITDSYTSPALEPSGITWDSTHVISADNNPGVTHKHYKHSGFSATITDSYDTPSISPYGVGWDGTHVISADYNADKHYKHSGFSATITSSYSSPSSTPTGITWDEASGGSYDVALTISQILTVAQATSQLNTTYTTIPIVRKRLRYIDSNLTDSDIEQFIFEAEGIIDAVMTDSMKDIFDAIKHDAIRACATDLAALQVLAYDPSVQPTIEAALMTADLLYNGSQETLRLISNPRNVKYWRSL